MYINMIVIYNANHHKLAFTQLAKNDLDYRNKAQKILNQSNQTDSLSYFIRRLDTVKPGIEGLKNYDVYYRDVQFYSNFYQFQDAVHYLIQLTDGDIKAYLLNRFNLNQAQTNQLFQMLLPKLDLPLIIENKSIDLMNVNQCRVNLTNKLFRQPNGYQQWELINQFSMNQSKIPLKSILKV